MMTRILSYISFLLILIFSLPAAISQEVLTGLEINPEVKAKYNKTPYLKSLSSKNAIMLDIPFFDDFSSSAVYPDTEKWSDRYAFINNSYPVNPVSLNVATLDAIDHTGSLYDHATTWPFIADHLTSRPLNLNLPPGDSIYLSFFFQPQGKGDIPQSHDSLRLEFYSPEKESWNVIWSVPGNIMHDFKLVMIPVKEPEYMQEGFRFRFSNIASISDNPYNPGATGNADHWHIDYVYLDKDRSFADTIFRDLAITESTGSLLNNYEAMPWRQFRAAQLAEMASVLPLIYRNNDNVTRSTTKRFSIFNIHEKVSTPIFSGGSRNISPGEIKLHNSDLAYTFNAENPDSALFRVKTWIETDDFDYKGNDTVEYYQNFSNYFALDDGTAENGYGLYGGGTENARIAYRFRAYKPDSLKAVKIYFNQSLNNASRQYFNLAVWDDHNGKPGDLIYYQEGERPVYEDELNRFHTYDLDSAIFISQVFYIGIIQTTTDFLNIGFDINRSNRNRIFYNIYGEWENTSFEGSLMMRPVVGSSTVTSSVKVPGKKNNLLIYPNPAREILYIDLEPEINPGSVTFSLFNRLGQMVYQGNGHNRNIDLKAFPSGVYFLRTEGLNIEFDTRKILITH